MRLRRVVGGDHVVALRLLGVEGNRGAELGLSADWAYNNIKAANSYDWHELGFQLPKSM